MNDTQLQRARNIAAFAYEDRELSRIESGKTPPNHTEESWRDHVASYTRYMREGAYDDDVVVLATLTALRQVEPLDAPA